MGIEMTIFVFPPFQGHSTGLCLSEWALGGGAGSAGRGGRCEQGR